VTQLVLHLHECAAEPLNATAEAATDPTAAGPLHSATASPAPTEASCLCVRV
jgi:hypothetical protein